VSGAENCAALSTIRPSGSGLTRAAATTLEARSRHAGASHAFDAEGTTGLSVRFDVIKLFDAKDEIRDGAPQYGPRRGFFGGASWAF